VDYRIRGTGDKNLASWHTFIPPIYGKVAESTELEMEVDNLSGNLPGFGLQQHYEHMDPIFAFQQHMKRSAFGYSIRKK
jgi:hypothetical protein